MKIEIRKEVSEDYPIIFRLVEEAFRDMEFADGDEHILVERLRQSDAYIPDLALVAHVDNLMVGHIMFTKAYIISDQGKKPSLCLAPVSVVPGFQRKGIGTALILAGHRIAKEMEYTSCMLVGHENFYPRFGYKMAKEFGIVFPFGAPDKNNLVVEFERGVLHGFEGKAEFASPFFN